MMDKKTEKLTNGEQLIQARESGLREAETINAMSAHGKVMGMDTFSWLNPQIDTLSKVISSFPFPLIWIGNHDQIKLFLENYPEACSNIESLIVQDTSLLNVDRNILQKIGSIACIEGTNHALELVKSIRKEKRAFLFTSDGANGADQIKNLKEFISQ